MPVKPKPGTNKATTKKRASATTKKRASATTKKRASATAKKNQVQYISNEEYALWETNVLDVLKSDKTRKSMSAKVHLLQRLFIVLDSDTSSWSAVEEKKNGRLFEMYDVSDGSMRTYFHRTPHNRRSVNLTQYIATDIRSVTHYTGVDNHSKWIVGIPTFTFTNKAFHKDGKVVKADAFVTEVLKAFFATQKSNAKSLKDANNPSKDKKVIQSIAKWFSSVQAIMNDATVTVKLAYATFNADRIPNRTDPLRLYVPANKVSSKVGSYYVKERDHETRKLCIRTCTNSECGDGRYLAVDVDDDKKIVDSAHLSINETAEYVKYQTAEK
jgi:hypothetical protein